MNTILYHDRHTVEEAKEMSLLATSRYGVEPRFMQIGVDVTLEEVEDICVIDTKQTGIPFLTSADSDDLIDLYDRDEEVEPDDLDESQCLSKDYNPNGY